MARIAAVEQRWQVGLAIAIVRENPRQEMIGGASQLRFTAVCHRTRKLKRSVKLSSLLESKQGEF